MYNLKVLCHASHMQQFWLKLGMLSVTMDDGFDRSAVWIGNVDPVLAKLNSQTRAETAVVATKCQVDFVNRFLGYGAFNLNALSYSVQSLGQPIEARRAAS